VTRRELLPVALVLLVTVTDAAGAASLSFYLLLAAVPAIVVAGLASLEELVQLGARPYRRAVGVLHAVALLLILVAAALRAPLRAEGTVPRAAISAVIACLVVFALQALITALPTIRRALARAMVRPEQPASEIVS
jgi:protein-S-isoprenylcysteine O-methyltransferase Ste14